MKKLIKAGAMAVALAWLVPATAQAIELRCLINHHFYERRGEVVTSAPAQTGAMTITVDLTSGAFVSGRTTTTAAVNETEIVALGSDDPRMLSLWVINRANGEINIATSGRTDVNLVFLTAEGQCRTIDGGATRF